MSSIQNRLLDYFRHVSLPNLACQFSSRYVSGVLVAPKDKTIKAQFVSPLEKGIILPSFYKKNIQDSSALESVLKPGLSKLGSRRPALVFLLPELSQKVFIFTFDALPSSPEEKEELILFRIKKQMPLLPRDARLAFEVVMVGERARVVAAVAKAAVVREYEEVFQRLKHKVTLAGVPSLSLLNLLDPDKDKDYVLVDVEDDSFSLVAVIDAVVFLYRQKHFGVNGDRENAATAKAENIVQDVLNTIQFIADKENKRLASVWVRLGILQTMDGLYEHMEERLALPLRRIESHPSPLLGEGDNQRILAPLIGQVT